MRLPVIARTFRQKWIEGLLPGCIRLHADVLAVRLAESAQRRDQPFACARITRITYSQRDDLLPMHVRRQEGQRRCLAGDHRHVEFIRHALGEAGELQKHGPRLVERKDDKAGQHIRSDRMELEFEAGDNACAGGSVSAIAAATMPRALRRPPDYADVRPIHGGEPAREVGIILAG